MVAVEGEAERIAQPVGEDLAAAGGGADEGIVGGHRVRQAPSGAVDVDAEDLAEEVVEVLGAVAGIVAGPAVAHGDVEESVGAELDHAAVVVGERLRDHEEHGLDAVGDARVGRRDAVLGDDGGTVGLPRVVDEESAIARELGMEGEAEQPALPAEEHLGGDVEEDDGGAGPGREHPDDARLLDDEQPMAAVPRVGHEVRIVEPVQHRYQPNGRARGIG